MAKERDTSPSEESASWRQGEVMSADEAHNEQKYSGFTHCHLMMTKGGMVKGEAGGQAGFTIRAIWGFFLTLPSSSLRPSSFPFSLPPFPLSFHPVFFFLNCYL